METVILIEFCCPLAHLQELLISFLSLVLLALYVLRLCQDPSTFDLFSILAYQQLSNSVV